MKFWNVAWGVIVGIGVHFHQYDIAAGFFTLTVCMYLFDIEGAINGREIVVLGRKEST